MDPPYLAATSRWSELPSGGLVAGGHSGGFASMLQYVAAGATWSQKSRVVGRQAFSFSSTSTANSKMASYGGGKHANRSDFYTEVASIAHSRAKRWKNGEGDINFFVTRKEEYQFKGERENGQPVVDAQPGRKPHERGVAEEKKGRSKKRTFGQNGRVGGGRMKLRARGKPSFLKTLENSKPDPWSSKRPSTVWKRASMRSRPRMEEHAEYNRCSNWRLRWLVATLFP